MVIENTISAKELANVKILIGNTPMVQISNLHKNSDVKIFAKLEWQQLSNSVKARAAFNIIASAIEKGLIHKGKGLIDASSGNTAVAYAAIGAKLGIPVTLCVPENAATPKKWALEMLGAEIIYTSRFGGTDEAQAKAKELSETRPDKYYFTNQYDNDYNWKAHFETTAPEIWQQTQGNITHFVAGLGTTGTFMGTTARLKHYDRKIQCIALQPDNALHGLEGWKHLETARVPKIFKSSMADKYLEIDTLDAYDMIKIAAKSQGLLLSPSAAANLFGAITIANRIETGVIVTTFADHLSNYPEVMENLNI